MVDNPNAESVGYNSSPGLVVPWEANGKQKRRNPDGVAPQLMNPNPRVAKAPPWAGIIQRFQRFDAESMRL